MWSFLFSPFFCFSLFALYYLKELHTLPNGVSLYVNSGIGFWGPPMRLGSQAEITYII
jgi:predicted MPP superfamily phosphohydrolase